MIRLMESGIGSVRLDRLAAAISDVTGLAGLRIATDAVTLMDVEASWNRDEGASQTVFLPAERFGYLTFG